MNKYIDADLLREKISEQMKLLPREVGRGAGTITSKGYGMMQAFQIMRSIIDSIQQEQTEINFEKELKNERAKLLDAFGPMNGEQSLAIKNFARHFCEYGMSVMRERITNPDYNQKVIEKIKSEYPMDESNVRKEE